MSEKKIQLNVPVRIDQVEKLAKAVAIAMASRERKEGNKRITKATFVRSLIDVIDFDEADLTDISDEDDLQSHLRDYIGKEQQRTKIDIDLITDIYKKFADDDQKKWIAGDFINTLFEHNLIEASSSEDLWAKILEKIE